MNKKFGLEHVYEVITWKTQTLVEIYILKFISEK
jgi:hypothetical protein